MTPLDAIAPATSSLVIDLVSSAGIDVSDWSNGKGGAAKASTNPKYCYEWAFIEPGKLVLLNLWHRRNVFENGRITQTNNFREDAQLYAAKGHGAWSKRASKVDQALRYALRDNLPIRVVLLAGDMKDLRLDKAVPSKVKFRSLDPEPWSLVTYDDETGLHTIARGILDEKFVDQFSIDQVEKAGSRRRETTSFAFFRNPEVRRQALRRAGGNCQLCGERGFRDGGRRGLLGNSPYRPT